MVRAGEETPSQLLVSPDQLRHLPRLQTDGESECTWRLLMIGLKENMATIGAVVEVVGGGGYQLPQSPPQIPQPETDSDQW